MDVEYLPLNEAERIYLRIRMITPSVIFGITVLGGAACVYLLARDWSPSAYFVLAVLVLDLAIAWTLLRVLRDISRDVKAGKKGAMRRTLTGKSSRNIKHRRYFFTIDGRQHRVSKEIYGRFEENDPITMFFAPKSKVLLGFLPPEENPGQ